jgi:hypothetical protein
MRPHSSHLSPLTGKSVKHLTKGLLARCIFASTYPAYLPLRPPSKKKSPFYGLSEPYAIQNNPFFLLNMAVFSHFPIQKSPDNTFSSYLSEVTCFHLQHLQPLMFTYIPARNPHLHTYPPFKGGKCEWWGGKIHD